jgi:molybdopterin molybdotransferase
VGGVPIVCFPGNPVSTQVSFTVFVRGLLRDAAGLPPLEPRTARLAAALQSVAGKRQFLRGRVTSANTVEQVSGSSSHLVAAMAKADVLIDIPADASHLDTGADVTVWTL